MSPDDRSVTDVGGHPVEAPRRAIVVLITDFFEGGPPGQLVARVKALCDQGSLVLGLAVGVAYAVLKPPMLSSTALIALPASVSQQQPSTTTSGNDPFTATQEVVAGSTQVLLDALGKRRLQPSERGQQSIDVGPHHALTSRSFGRC